jgi:tetratricopeptide (TPR) repeat protein
MLEIDSDHQLTTHDSKLIFVKKAVPIVLIFLAAGCGNSLKYSWNNFTAYYNTFYNARKNFKAGIGKVKQQPVQFYPDTLILPHRIPPLAGKEDFEQADQDASQLLRRFPDSKWAYDALLLLGKSYYYQHEFFKAQQKFEGIIDLSGQASLKQKAILWKGRVLLNTHSYRSSIQFLSKSLSLFNGKWQPFQKAKVHILMAENLAMLGNWNKAAALFAKALPNVRHQALAGEGYFLLGQVWQKSGHFRKAFNAYNQVKKMRPGYVYSYWAGLKKAEMARLTGRLHQAISICSAMATNDKNFRRRNEIYYQQGLNYMADRRYTRAETWFKKVLANREDKNSVRLRNLSYEKLGILYSKYLKNYVLAVAYFDSASAQSMRTTLFRNNSQTRKTFAYKRYAALKKDIQNLDSLLKLGSLGKKELRKKLIILRRQRRKTLQKSGEAVQSQHILNKSAGNHFKSYHFANKASQDGFLDYKNPRIVRHEERQFAVVWGSRPLIDNWRRKEIISSTNISNAAGRNNSDSLSQKNKTAARAVRMGAFDLAEIPRTQKARKKLRDRRLLDQYQLGNLFFLSLDKPDSAAHYYHLALEGNPSGQVKSQTLYSLYQLFHSNHQPDSARVYKHKILQEFPSSRYAKQIVSHSGEATPAENLSRDSNETLLPEMHRILNKKDSLNNKEAALKLQQLAVKHQQDEAAPAVYMKSIRKYIKFAEARDSAQPASDSLKSTADTNSIYQGKYWDRVRSMLKEFLKLFPDASKRKQVNMWLAVLKTPASDNEIATCKELRIRPKIIGGKKQFLQSVKMPEQLKGMYISGSIRFRLIIQKDGSVSSEELLSKPTNLGIEPAYVKAIQKSLHFKPVKVNGKRVKVSCIMSFPIRSK